ncbi:MAG: gamma-glutamyl-gamma-aminobutyrate hydrolase family protein [Flavobacteriales bacterium]|nr:gamma-glutamyl-gamma-aminobutyrate hydrolase family protein [Flavobacteriales bacterium]
MRFWPLLLVVLLFLGCIEKPADSREILISMYYPNNDYQRWLLHFDSTLTFYQAYGMSSDSLEVVLKQIDGIILTGGKDIHPSLSGKDSLIAQCGPIDEYRDSLELALVSHAFEQKIPLFGGCRGMQLLNVAKGGSLIIDIPTTRNSNIHKQQEGDAHHMVYCHPWLANILEQDSGSVNSNHHQAVDRLAEGFKVMAVAQDSIVEAFYWEDKSSHPFVLGVQWHPERMERDDPMAANLARIFIKNLESPTQ